MNHRQIAFMVAGVITSKHQTDKIRAIRLYVEKTTGMKVADSNKDDFLDAMVAAMDGEATEKANSEEE